MPNLAVARTLVEGFQAVIRSKVVTDLDTWIRQAKVSLVAPLALSVARDVGP